MTCAEDLTALAAATAFGPVTALLLGPQSIEALAPAARAHGAKRVVRLWDRSLDETDYLGLAIACAAALRHLLELGSQSRLWTLVGGDDSAVLPAVAERLGIPHVGRVAALEGTRRPAQALLQRVENGARRRYSLALPAVFCVTASAPVLAEPAGKGDRVEVLTFSDIGLTPGEVQYRRRFRPSKPVASRLLPARFESAASLIERLKQDGLIN